MGVRWSGLKSQFSAGEILVMPRLEPPQSSEPLRLLIADDDPMIPEMLAERLKLCFIDQAVEIYQVASAEEALKLLFEQPIDLLLTDYDFSQGGRNEAITGLALLRQIREHRIVVTTIFMTGFGDEEVAKNAILQGAADYLTKPQLKGLDSVVKRCAEQHSGRLQQAALRNAAQLLEISEALNRPGSRELGAELVLQAAFKEVDCDLAWITMSSPSDGIPHLQRVLREDESLNLPKANLILSKHGEARFAQAQEIAQRFESDGPQRLWIRPLVMERSESGQQRVIGELCVAYFDRVHRFHPGRRRTLEVIANHSENLITQQFLRHDIERSFGETIQVLVQALEMHDEYTAGHSDWVGVYARLGALAMGWDARAVARAGHAGLLHDIGKVRLDSSMINHPGRLSDEQFEHFRAHPSVGAEMLKPLRSMQDVLPAVCWHHERFEGGGYPSGVASSLLPPLARLMCIADSYDAMTSHRAYRRAMSHKQAVGELRRCAGQQFDPAMIEPFIVALAAFRRLVRRWAQQLIETRELVDAKSLLSQLNEVFDAPWTADELLLDEGEQTQHQLADARLVPLDRNGLAAVFVSLEEGLNDAGRLFLTAIKSGSDEDLAAQMEAASERSDHRLQRLIAQVWLEQNH
ncbi:MAG: response regulator [Myxococcota bacterium]|nr:response regulator [Myxococcota bacterium]